MPIAQIVVATAFTLAAVLCEKKHPLLQIALWTAAILCFTGRHDIQIGAVIVCMMAAFLIVYKDNLSFWYPEFTTLKLVIRLLAVPPYI